jgi:transcriptional regulator with XRE-family HTH domain
MSDSQEARAEPAIPQWDLPDRLTKALKHAGMKPGDMRDYLDCSPASLTNWTSGRVRPRTQTLRLWALRTGVSYEWLIGGDCDGPDLDGELTVTCPQLRGCAA